MAKPSLSVLLIAKDEERDLPGWLENVKGVSSEIVVVVDESSADRTEELARAAGAKVLKRRFDDYARQRQAALELCTQEWVLWLDADERLSSALLDNIAGPLHGPADGYVLPFRIRFLGKTMRFGGLGREKHLRLFRRSKARFVGGALHEGIELAGTAVRFPLEGAVVHEPYHDLADYESKLDRYTTLAAQKRHEMGRRFHFWDALRPAWELFSRLVLRLGILDGSRGLTWARLAARHTRLKYAKLRKLGNS
jgi:glycosyltransferase involved in cell wall biosynthesis